MLDHQLIAFTLTVGALTLVPGADTMLVMRNVLRRGRVAGVVTALGIGSGLFVQAMVSALGLSAILMSSAELYTAVKLAGALYLAGLGLWTIVTARRTDHQAQTTLLEADVSPSHGRSYVEGLLTNVLNPKVVVFYLAFLPQFIAPTDPVIQKSMLLAGIHFTLGMVWLSALSLGIARMGTWLSSPTARRRLDYITGSVLVALGARLALDRG